MGRLGEFLKRRKAKRLCREGEHQRSGSQARQTPEGWESVCRYCGVPLHRKDRLERWRVKE